MIINFEIQSSLIFKKKVYFCNMIFKIKYILTGSILLLISSCTINSNRMLRTPRNYEFDEIDSKLNELEYKIDVNDQLTFQLYTNNGFQLIDMFSSIWKWRNSKTNVNAKWRRAGRFRIRFIIFG